MKKVLTILTLIFASCETPDPKTIHSQELGGRIINTYMIDDCEYLGELGGGDFKNDILTHKGNCKNPHHRDNNLK